MFPFVLRKPHVAPTAGKEGLGKFPKNKPLNSNFRRVRNNNAVVREIAVQPAKSTNILNLRQSYIIESELRNTTSGFDAIDSNNGNDIQPSNGRSHNRSGRASCYIIVANTIKRRTVYPKHSLWKWTKCFKNKIKRSSAAKGKRKKLISPGGTNTDGSAYNYLVTYYNIMYLFGICTYKCGSGEENPCCIGVLRSVLQKVCFWILAILSVSHSIFVGKYNLLGFLSGAGFSAFVDFSYHLTLLITKLYSIHLFYQKGKESKEMLRVIIKYTSSCCTLQLIENNEWKRKLPWIAGITTLFVGCARTVFRAATSEWSLRSSLLTASYIASEDLFLWSSNNQENVTDKLFQDYGTNLTALSTTLGGVAIARSFAANFQIGMLQNLIMFVAVTVLLLINDFISQVKETMQNAPEEDRRATRKLQRRREKVWKKYRMLKEAMVKINDVYDPILKLMHIGNLLMYAYFMTQCIFKETTTIMTIVLQAVNLIKSEIAYHIAGKIAEQNGVLGAWLRNWALYTGKINVGGREMDVNVLLHELEKEPLGLGKGAFVIQETFHLKFLGLVGSTFFSLADEYKTAQ